MSFSLFWIYFPNGYNLDLFFGSFIYLDKSFFIFDEFINEYIFFSNSELISLESLFIFNFQILSRKFSLLLSLLFESFPSIELYNFSENL